MKTNLLTITLMAGALAGGLCLTQAQSSGGGPNPVISSPRTPESSPPESTNAPQSTGSRIGTALENVLGRVFGRNQSQLTLDQLPRPVQDTVRAQAGTAPIQNISQVNTNGQTLYLVTFNRNGQPVDLQIDPSGRITNLSPAGRPVPGAPATVSVPDWRTAPVRQPLSQASPIGRESLPQAVRDTLTRYAGAGEIGILERGMVSGETVYQAQLQPSGQRIDLRVTETGALVNDQVNDRFLAELQSAPNRNGGTGRGPAWQTGAGSSSSSGVAPLSNISQVSLDQLPVAAQTTISAQAGAAPVNPVTQGTLNGRTVYEASYNKDGQWVTLRVGEDGSLLSSPVNGR
jgi:hypothetical protein